MTMPANLTLGNCTETTLLRRILGKTRYVACTEAAALDALSWARPSTSLIAKSLDALYAVGAHTPNGGRTTAQIRAAVLARYGHAPEGVKSMADALTHLRAGYVLTVAGNYHVLPTNLQRWDRNFAKNPEAWHDVCVGPIDPDSAATDDPWVWWRDPLWHGSPWYPWLYNFKGEWVRWSVVKTFALGSGDILAYPKGSWA
jgi:hypothetical protein